MKVHKIFTIDLEAAEKLNNIPNQSGLVNDLLLNHFREQDLNITNDPKNIAIYKKLIIEKKEKAKILKNKKQEAEDKMQEWRSGKITEKQYWKWIDGQ